MSCQKENQTLRTRGRMKRPGMKSLGRRSRRSEETSAARLKAAWNNEAARDSTADQMTLYGKNDLAFTLTAGMERFVRAGAE